MRPGDERDAEAPAETFTDIARRLGRVPLLLRMLLVAVPLAALGVALVPQPFTSLPATLIGIPLLVWLIRRDQVRRPSQSGDGGGNGDGDGVEDGEAAQNGPR